MVKQNHCDQTTKSTNQPTKTMDQQENEQPILQKRITSLKKTINQQTKTGTTDQKTEKTINEK